MDNLPLLSLVTFLPILGVAAIATLGRDKADSARLIALVTTIVVFLVSLPLLDYDPAVVGYQFVERYEWVPSWGIQWSVGLDGISLWLVLLTTFLGPIVVLGSWTAVDKRPQEFFIHLLALQTFMTGALLALNLAVFYVFWELMLVPMFFLIGVWGGAERLYATIKFVLYTVVGSMLMFVAILYLYWLHHEQFGTWSLEFADLMQVQMGGNVQVWLFAAFAFAFAIKVPMFPLHTWLPDAHVQAPTAGSVVLAGVLLKMGTYGFLRLGMPLFPVAVAEWGWLILALGVVGIVYGALVAMVQPDIKKLVAYSSVSHMGYIMMGLFALNPQGVQGAILQMLNHGISTGALFLLVGVIYERTHTRRVWDFGGLAAVMPVYTAIFVVVALSSAGLPGTNGFVGEFLTLLGAFRWAHDLHGQGATVLSTYGYVAAAALGVIFGAVYLLWTIERVFFGPVTQDRWKHLPDLSRREIAVFAPLLVMIFWMGFYPKPFLDKIDAPVERWLTDLEAREVASRELPADAGSPSNPTPSARRVAQAQE